MHIELLDALGANLDALGPSVDHLTSLVADGAAALDMPQELDMPMSELKEKAFELDSLGSDVLIFLAASTFVVPLSRLAGISPVLGFLAIGCAIGPYGLQLFSDSQADVELGDFGILFLLFVEGLNLSPEKLRELGAFFRLGAFQLILSAALFFFGTLIGGPLILPTVENLGIPLDDAILRPILSSPVESFCIAAAGALSSSAFVLPVLKQKNWEASPDGIAALSILLLQDLAVAPLLVVLPLVAGTGPQDPQTLGLLAAKATFGFGAVLWACSYLLRLAFELVASARSTETFVAATLLVAVGMGRAAEELGLSATTGAFAAGVLLAGNKFRAQIQADIKPFEGILLGVFFMTAGANLDPQLVLREWPTLSVGIVAFIVTKAAVLFAAGPALGLARAEAAKVALLLAGGGEFAFVVFKLAKDLGVLPDELGKLLTASVIISMSLTPLLGEVAGWVADRIEDAEGSAPEGKRLRAAETTAATAAAIPASQTVDADAIVVCGYGDVGRAFARSAGGGGGGGDLVAFDLNPARVSAAGLDDDGPPLFYGDGASVELLRAAGLRAPRAIVITYRLLRRRVDATIRLREAFPKTPIYTRGSTAAEADELRRAGATEVVTESVEVAIRLGALLGGGEASDAAARLRSGAAEPRALEAVGASEGWTPESLEALADEVGSTRSELERLYSIFADMDADESSEVDLGELRDAMLRAGFFGAVVDDDSLQKWFDEADLDVNGRVSFSEFARISVSGLDYFGSDHAGESE